MFGREEIHVMIFLLSFFLDVRMNFLGILNFNAPYLPWVMTGFTVLFNNVWPWGDFLGLAIGHVYYFLEDVYPRMPHSGGRRLLRAPVLLREFFMNWNRDVRNAAMEQQQHED